MKRLFAYLCLSFLLSGSVPVTASGDTIGVNFTGRLSNFNIPLSLHVEFGESASGVAGVNGNDVWNDLITYHDQGVAGTIGPWRVFGSEGGSAAVTVRSQGTWSKLTKGTRIVPSEDPSGDMMDGWICAGNSRPVTVNVSELSGHFALYDVYAYIGGSDADKRAAVTLNDSAPVAYTTRIFDGDFIQATGSGTDTADYVLFPGVTGDSFTLVVSGPGTGLHGLEIVGVPEPSTVVLLGMGAVGLLGYALRRRKAA